MSTDIARMTPQHTEAPVDPRPLPVTRMMWVTWRLHRAALLALAVLLIAASATLLISGLVLRSTWDSLQQQTCLLLGSNVQIQGSACVLVRVAGRYAPVGFGVELLHMVPGLIGMFLGAPLLARDLELGTARFAWSQGISPLRWTATKLALVTGVAAVAVLPVGLLFSWWYPRGRFVLWTTMSWPATSYDLFPGPIVRWTLLAVVLGALAGLLFRHTVAAMAVTAVSYALLIVVSLALNYRPAAGPGFWLWECTEGDGLLVLTAALAAVLLWQVHRRPQC